MSKNTFQLYLNGQDYSANINYPVSIVDKRLEDSFNTYTVSLNRLDGAEPFIPHQKVELNWLVDGVVKQYYPSLLLADAVEKIGVLDKYKHNLNLIEYTYYLDLLILPDMTITRVENVYEPTLADVVNRVLSVAGKEVSPNGLGILLDTETSNILDAIISPEWTFTRMTVYEAIRMVFAYAKIVPRMIDFTYLGYISPFPIDETPQKIGRFFTKTQAYNPQTYRTRIVSSVENFIAGDKEAAITEPANGWLTPRSADNYAISNDSAIIPTNRPIYKVENLEFARWIAVARIPSGQTTRKWVVVPYELIATEWYIKQTKDFLFEESVWNSKENIEEFGQRGGSFYYKQGEPHIQNLGYRSPTRWTWNPAEQSWIVILKELSSNFVPKITLSEWIKASFISTAENIAKNYWESVYGTPSNSECYYTMTFNDENELIGELPDTSSITLPELRFRITYTPYTDTMISTYRERKDNTEELFTSQFYNQQANVISSDVLGELHDRVSKSNSGNEQNLIYLHNSYDEVLSSGYRFEDYIITTGSHNVNYTSIHSTYSFDKYFVKLNTYVAVLEKWRQFSIPNEGVVKRQYTIHKFDKFTYT